jgi:dTDP-glucose pyrophosphorylase
LFEQLPGDGGRWGLNLQYAVQHKPQGIPRFLVGEKFIGSSRSALVLGDSKSVIDAAQEGLRGWTSGCLLLRSKHSLFIQTIEDAAGA